MKIINSIVAIFLNVIKIRTFTIGAILALTFGIIANANADHILWASTGNTNANGGGRIYTINPETGSVTLVGNTTLDKLGALAFDNNGILYGVAGGSRGPANLYTFDTITAAPTFVGTVVATNLAGIDAIDFDSAGTLFATGWFGGNPVRLLTLNPATASVVDDDLLIGGTGNGHVPGLAFDATDQLFGSRGSSGGHLEDLVSINTTTFVQTAIGGSTEFISDIAITRDGTLYGGSTPSGSTGGSTDPSALFTIDPITGVKVSLISDTGIRIAGLTTHDSPTTTSGTPVIGPNGNFYEFVTAAGITWDAAHTVATNLTFNGAVGHLATITSMEEDDFIEAQRQLTPLFEVWVGGFQNPASTLGAGDNWTWVNGEGSFPGTNGGTVYANWGGSEPNDFYGPGTEQHSTVGFGNAQSWNDEGVTAATGLGNITGFVVEYECCTATVQPGPDVLIFGQANVPGSPNPLSAAYDEVIEGGKVTIDCCRVLDTREGTGTTHKYGDYDPVILDIGKQFSALDPDNLPNLLNPTCADMPDIGPDVFVLRPWQRGIPESKALSSDGSAREHDLGACVIQSAAVTKGVFFTEEAPENVLGFSLNYSVTDIQFRPYTGGVAFNPAEIDAPFVTRWSAETNGPRSAKKGSDNGFILNLWHFTDHNATKPYLSRLAGNLLDSIEYERSREDDLTADPPIPAPCVDNTAFFLDNLFDLVTAAKANFRKKGDPVTAVATLDDATKLALLLTYTGPGDPYDVDPLGEVSSDVCPGNPKGLFVGRLLGLRHATCSEIGEGAPPMNAQAPSKCAIPDDIRTALPTLP